MKRLIVLLCFLGSSQLAMARDYCNVRFHYCVDIPSQLKWLPEATNGDGRHFKLSNSKSEVLVYGSYSPLVFDYTDSGYLKEKQRRYNTGTVVTYELLKEKTYTVSGYKNDGQIFYHITKVNDGTEAVLHLNYPENESKKMAGIVKKMARSFILH